MAAAVQIPSVMTLQEFLAWNGPWGPAWQLVDGEPRSMAPASRTHGTIQAELSLLIGNHFRDQASPCSIVSAPGVVPQVRSDSNFRIPDLAVTCTPYHHEEYSLADPVLIIEILSPSNRPETWTNVWAYTTIPSVQEILIVRSTEIGVDLLRRDPAGNWPERALAIESGMLELQSIGFSVDLLAIYRGTRLLPG